MGRLLAGALSLLALGVSGCGVMGDPWGDTGDKVRVIVTVPPLASFVHAVGGDHVAVKCLCTKVGPHHYEAETADLAAFATAKLFLSVGLTLDDKFAYDLFARARRKDLPFIKLGEKLPKKQLIELKQAEEHKGHKHEGHQHGKWDPHVWLGIPEAIHMVETVRDRLCDIDEGHKDDYKKNAAEYIKKLKEIQEKGQELMKEGKLPKRIITFHESFRYFARTFKDDAKAPKGIEIANVVEEGPGDEPVAAKIQEIVEQIKSSKDKSPIACITVEPQYKGGSVDLVKKALGEDMVPVVEIDPMETADEKDLEKEKGDWYLRRLGTFPREGKPKFKGILNKLADVVASE